MASATGTVRHPKGPAEPPTGPDASAYCRSLVESTVGGKVLVALTGLGLVLFVVFHMIGNLKLLQGPEAINHYAYFLKHDLGALIWLARLGLLAIFVAHLGLAIKLTLRSAAARPVPYAFPGRAQATVYSRTMIGTGAVILLFTVFHLAHFTFAWGFGVEVPQPGTGQTVWTNYLDLRDYRDPLRHDVYEMMVAGFSNKFLAGLYLVGQVALFAHLRHGVPSLFQTLGLKNARFRRPIDLFGLAVALIVFVGNTAIVVSVLAGLVPSHYRG